MWGDSACSSTADSGFTLSSCLCSLLFFPSNPPHLPSSLFVPPLFFLFVPVLPLLLSSLHFLSVCSQYETTTLGCCCFSSPSSLSSASLCSTCLWAWWWKTFTSVASSRRRRRRGWERRNGRDGWRRGGEVSEHEGKGGVARHSVYDQKYVDTWIFPYVIFKHVVDIILLLCQPPVF